MEQEIRHVVISSMEYRTIALLVFHGWNSKIALMMFHGWNSKVALLVFLGWNNEVALLVFHGWNSKVALLVFHGWNSKLALLVVHGWNSRVALLLCFMSAIRKSPCYYLRHGIGHLPRCYFTRMLCKSTLALTGQHSVHSDISDISEYCGERSWFL